MKTKTIMLGAIFAMVCVYGANALTEAECDVTPGMTWNGTTCIGEGTGNETYDSELDDFKGGCADIFIKLCKQHGNLRDKKRDECDDPEIVCKLSKDYSVAQSIYRDYMFPVLFKERNEKFNVTCTEYIQKGNLMLDDYYITVMQMKMDYNHTEDAKQYRKLVSKQQCPED